MKTLTIRQPDDWHLHLRDGALLPSVLPHTAQRFARAIVMPNLNPPVTTTKQAGHYRERIMAALPKGISFEPLMTIYLTDNTTPQEIAEAKKSGIVHAVKYYPAGATTNSDSGVTHVEKTFDTLQAMEAHGLPLLLHGEVTDPGVDVFDRERVFIERILSGLAEQFRSLKMVLEHVSTKEGVDFVSSARPGIAGTITAHHLIYNRSALFQGGLRPHHFCLPVLKRERHRAALVEAATGDSGRFFLGTDSAPHTKTSKENECGCAGIYTAHAALELYAEVFDSVDRLDKLEAFASIYGPEFYGLDANTRQVTLVEKKWSPPLEYPFGEETLVPLRAGETVAWRFEEQA